MSSPPQALAYSTMMTTWLRPSTCTPSCICHCSNVPELLVAFTPLLVGRQRDDVPVLHNASTVQRVVHAEFRMMQQLGYELTTLTPMAWVDIFRQRFTLRKQQLQGNLLSRLQPAIRAEPSLSLLIRLPEPTFRMPNQSHLQSQPSWHNKLETLFKLAMNVCAGSSRKKKKHESKFTEIVPNNAHYYDESHAFQINGAQPIDIGQRG